MNINSLINMVVRQVVRVVVNKGVNAGIDMASRRGSGAKAEGPPVANKSDIKNMQQTLKVAKRIGRF